MTQRKYFTVIFGFLSILSITGCSYLPQAMVHIPRAGRELIWGQDVNLIEKNYAAADYMIQQASNRFHTYELTVVEPLINLDAPKLTSEFAKVIPQQIGQRFLQLGYKIDQSQVSNPNDESLAKEFSGQPINFVKGTYRKTKENGYEINMRIVKSRSGDVISAFTYLLPYNSDIKKMAEHKPLFIAYHMTQ